MFYWPSFLSGAGLFAGMAVYDYYTAWLAGASSADIAAVANYCSNGGCF